ncbi:hypothetical protein N181_25250 [Sinorhizobium fredii USDA 205]|uniref:BppU N-terminal domain-containing protein n=2 Tax=Sinorhizobium TaxID=28105 RepID=A0A844AGF1_RHIFR|nr:MULTISPECIES: hypothetical protein [Sinorhizobium]KSV83685.1 hypothetical protein N181_25250 [Sinorhizobium fredii USDA 205]MQX10736.1 hypothetical protein [Sinorhizobium fredii]OAP40354.1 hypothetical protein AU381_00045 [Sinorhizobium glycinis]GEC33564.1 hypothetical protein EFR01_37350 [Sinorhizobium fredii]GLS11865.1 hypothetical protein GCM10007864_54970 [Sinorhizobium fredii]
MFEARFEQVSNRADWVQPFEIVDDDTGETITDFTGVEVTIEVREQGSSYARLSASIDNGKITDLGNGVLEWQFPRSDMTGLCSGSYEIGVTIERDDLTTQYLIGIVPIVDGIVSI